jgi:hypothetical protein
MAFFRASSASAKLPARLGVGVLLLLLSDPPLTPTPESRVCSPAGFLPAAGRLAGGWGAAGFALAAAPFAAGGGGGGRGAATGAGAGAGACSST